MTDTFDRVIGSLDGLPDVRHTRPTTVTTVHPLIGQSQTFVVQTYRQHEQGDTIFVQYIDSEGGDRLVIPPLVADAIARQRDSLTKMVAVRPVGAAPKLEQRGASSPRSSRARLSSAVLHSDDG